MSADTETPLGRFRVVMRQDCVVAAGFVTRDLGDSAPLAGNPAEPATKHASHHALGDGVVDAPREASPIGRVLSQVDEYFSGARTAFHVAIRPSGTPFQLRVWGLLGEIPFGETVSYGELAAELGDPGASRAVGAANGRNPVGLIIPCHRVIATSGALTGYAGGIKRKHSLLALERRVRFGSLGI